MNAMYFVKVHVKPYVYRWLIRNYSVNVSGVRHAISLKKNAELQSIFRALLVNEPYSHNCDEAVTKLVRRTCEVYVYAGEKAFTHGQYNFTYTSEQVFNSHVEAIIKSDFVAYANFEYMFVQKLGDIIERYKQLNGFTEDDWPTNTMHQILNRKNLKQYRKSARAHFLEMSDTFFATELSRLQSQKRIKYEKK